MSAASTTIWTLSLRSVLEALYFLSGPIIAAAAIIGLRQISELRTTREESRRTSAVREAGMLTKHLLFDSQSALDEAYDETRDLPLGGLDHNVDAKFNWSELSSDEASELERSLVGKKMMVGPVDRWITCLAYVALLVNEDVADDSTTYRMCGELFLDETTRYAPLIAWIRIQFPWYGREIEQTYVRWQSRWRAEQSSAASSSGV